MAEGRRLVSWRRLESRWLALVGQVERGWDTIFLFAWLAFGVSRKEVVGFNIGLYGQGGFEEGTRAAGRLLLVCDGGAGKPKPTMSCRDGDIESQRVKCWLDHVCLRFALPVVLPRASLKVVSSPSVCGK